MSDNTFENYLVAVQEAAQANPNWRLGQAAFNVLWQMRPDLAEQVRGTAIDPFHDTSLCRAFNDWVHDHWDASERATPAN